MIQLALERQFMESVLFWQLRYDNAPIFCRIVIISNMTVLRSWENSNYQLSLISLVFVILRSSQLFFCFLLFARYLLHTKEV